MERVAVVTGANKGIGLEIVRGLLQRWPGLVYLTARDEARGRGALASLGALGALGGRARFHALDVAREDSVRALAAHLQARHGPGCLDLLVHNAAVVQLEHSTPEQDEEVVAINYGSLALLERALFPLLRAGARVLNVSSDCGHLSNVRDPQWRARLARPDLTAADVDAFAAWYLQLKRRGELRGDELADGGSVGAYRVAKVALSARTRLQAEALRARGVAANCVHPGLVRTDMTRGVGFLSAAEAAATPLWLLLEAPPSLSGAYVWFDRRVLPWEDFHADYYFKAATLRPKDA